MVAKPGPGIDDLPNFASRDVRLTGYIGRGGFAVVFKGKLELNGNDVAVAVKAVSKGTGGSAHFAIRSLVQECSILRRFDHECASRVCRPGLGSERIWHATLQIPPRASHRTAPNVLHMSVTDQLIYSVSCLLEKSLRRTSFVGVVHNGAAGNGSALSRKVCAHLLLRAGASCQCLASPSCLQLSSSEARTA